MADSEYAYDYTQRGETIQLGVGCSGVTREPRVKWQVGDQRGKYGYITLDAPNPVVWLEKGETVRLGERVVAELPVSREIGEVLKAACETLGTIVSESNRIETDPTAFPTQIAGFERAGWEADRNVMWYWRDERSSPRAYQIERGGVVFRAQEWSDYNVASKQELINHYDLASSCKR